MPAVLPAKLPSVDSQYFTEPRKLEDFCIERQHGTQADYPVAWRKAVCIPSQALAKLDQLDHMSHWLRAGAIVVAAFSLSRPLKHAQNMLLSSSTERQCFDRIFQMAR